MNYVDCEHIFRLWDELAAFPSSERDNAWKHLATTVAGWIRADMVYWVANVRLQHGEKATRDVLFGWRAKAISFLDPPTEQEKLAAKNHVQHRLRDPGMTTIEA